MYFCSNSGQATDKNMLFIRLNMLFTGENSATFCRVFQLEISHHVVSSTTNHSPCSQRVQLHYEAPCRKELHIHFPVVANSLTCVTYFYDQSTKL